MKEKLTEQPREFIHTKQKDISNLDEYDELFLFTNGDSSKTVREKALEKAWQVRDFEIEMYWKRATYFWAFIASIFVAYFASLGEISKNFPQLQFIISCMGFVFSIAWLLVNIGSKRWQENWEGHIDRLEDNFTGPLYKTVKKYGINFSVSKINIIISAFVVIIWMLIIIIYIVTYITFVNNGKVAWIEISASLISFMMLIVFFTYGLSGSTKKKHKYSIREIK